MTTYSINVDDVDLSSLRMRTPYNNFLKKEYYNFELVKTVSLEVPEPNNTYTCHICAIDVPSAYAREHDASVKHRANARIASEAAQRTRALITALPPPHTAQTTARFCTNCSIVADEDHDSTKEHKVAVMHDNLLWELMRAYVVDDSNYDSDLLEKTRNHNNKNYTDFEHVDGIGNNNIVDAEPQDKNQPKEALDEKKEHNSIEQKEHVAKYCPKNNNPEQQSEDNDVANDVSDTSNTSNINGDIRGNTINTDDTDAVDTLLSKDIMIDSQNEYPYEVTGVGHVTCVVCQCQVPNVERCKKEHLIGSRHRNKVINMDPSTDPKTEDVEQHVENHDSNENPKEYNDTTQGNTNVGNDAHKTKPSDVIVDSQIGYPYEASVIGHVRCVVCNCQVPRGECNRQEHIKGNRHRTMVINVSNPTSQIEMKEQEKYEDEEFINGTNNINISSELSEANTAVKVTSSNVVDSKIEFPFEIINPYQAWCLLCECAVCNNLISKDEHIERARHRAMELRLHNQIFPPPMGSLEEEEYMADEEFRDDVTDNTRMSTDIDGDSDVDSKIEYPYKESTKGHLWCVVCDCQIPGGESNKVVHIKGNIHRNKVINMNPARPIGRVGRELKYEEFADSLNYNWRTNRDITEANDRDIRVDSKIKYPFEADARGRLWCIPCRCHVPSDARSRKQHILGLRHGNNTATG